MAENLNFEAPKEVSPISGWVKMIKKNVAITIAIVVAAIVIAGAIFYVGYYKQKKGTLTAQEAANKAIDFINKNLLTPGTTASLATTTEESGIYRFKLKIQNQEYDSYVTKDGRLLFTQAIDMTAMPSTSTSTQQGNSGQGGTQQASTTIGDFAISSDTICQENEKPIIYFFGSESCPHCQWEKPIFEAVVNNFKDYISFHENIDSQTDSAVFNKYSTGGIPTLVLGCEYYRVGSGEAVGQQTETQNLTALFCKLTGGKPASVCASVQNLISQIQ